MGRCMRALRASVRVVCRLSRCSVCVFVLSAVVASACADTASPAQQPPLPLLLLPVRTLTSVWRCPLSACCRALSLRRR